MHSFAVLFLAPITICGESLGDPPTFEAPVRLVADGVPIDVSAGAGHAAPLFADVLGDALPDLVVGDLAGRFQVFENVGERTAPRFVGRGPLTLDGKPIEVHNW